MASASLSLGVQPLVMTLGYGPPATQGIIIARSQRILASRSIVPDFIHARAIGSDRLGIHPLRLVFVAADRRAFVMVTLKKTRLRPPSLCDWRQPRRPLLAGVRVWRLLLIDYIVCALLASIAGDLSLVGHTNSADLSLATTYLLPSIAAVIIGGTSIFGGSGGYSGTIIGALILTVLDGLLTLLDLARADQADPLWRDHLHPGRGLFAPDRVRLSLRSVSRSGVPRSLPTRSWSARRRQNRRTLCPSRG